MWMGDRPESRNSPGLIALRQDIRPNIASARQGVEAIPHLPRCLAYGPRGEFEMRSNSGNGKSSNNTGNPTLKEHERAKGVSGEAIHGEKKSASTPDRQSVRKNQSS
jgi:hypothetical protein